MKTFFISLLTVVLTACAACPRPETSVLREQLKEHTLVVYKDGKPTFYDERGIQPLLIQIKQGTLKDAFVADRVVGKAAALLHVYAQVKEVYTPVLSKQAIPVYEKHNIPYTADKIIDNIRNRTNTDLCPMEKKVQNVNDPAEAYRLFSKQ